MIWNSHQHQSAIDQDTFNTKEILKHWKIYPTLITSKNACRPVIALPRMSECTSWVPSYVLTVSRFTMCLMTWYSSTIPLPPCMSRASLAASNACSNIIINRWIMVGSLIGLEEALRLNQSHALLGKDCITHSDKRFDDQFRMKLYHIFSICIRYFNIGFFIQVNQQQMAICRKCHFTCEQHWS